MVTSLRLDRRTSSSTPSMFRTFRPRSRGRLRRLSRTYSSRSPAGRCAMSERIPFPLDADARATWRPLKRRGFMNSSMVQLTLVRCREFIREPEAVFWTFVFPILLAAGLGIAFRQRGPEKVQVGVVGSAAGAAAVIDALKRDSTLVVETYDDSAAAR